VQKLEQLLAANTDASLIDGMMMMMMMLIDGSRLAGKRVRICRRRGVFETLAGRARVL
jgi:hypothetical protein